MSRISCQYYSEQVIKSFLGAECRFYKKMDHLQGVECSKP